MPLADTIINFGKLLNKLLAYKSTMIYILLIIIINSIFSYFPDVTVIGQSFNPADITVGCIYIFRDFSQREIKHYVLLAMLIGGGLSYLFSVPAVAVASLYAFFTGELIDWLIFTLTKKPLSQRLLLSALCSCPIDSIVFLYFINHLHWLEFTLITVAKFAGVFIVWWYWKFKRSDATLIPCIENG